MNSSIEKSSDQTIQELLNAELKAEAELSEMDENIFALENKVLGKNWWDGNFVIKWSRHLNQEKDHQLNLHPKDRMFSISSVTSKTSAKLAKFENEILDNNPTHAKNEARKYFLFNEENFIQKRRMTKNSKTNTKKLNFKDPNLQKNAELRDQKIKTKEKQNLLQKPIKEELKINYTETSA